MDNKEGTVKKPTRVKKAEPKADPKLAKSVILRVRRVGSDELGNLLYKEQRWTGTIQDYKQFLAMGYQRKTMQGETVIYNDMVILEEVHIPENCPTAEEFNKKRFNN